MGEFKYDSSVVAVRHIRTKHMIRLQMLHPYADTYYSAIQNNRSCKVNKVQAKQSTSQTVRSYCTYRHKRADRELKY